MLTSVNGATSAGAWYTSLQASGTAASSGANTFEQQLLNVIAESLEKAAESVGASESTPASTASQAETVESAKRQVSDSCTSSVDGSSAAAAAADEVESAASDSSEQTATVSDAQAASSVNSTEDASATTEPEVLTRLKAALEAAGHNPGDYNLVYEDRTEWYPGGTYPNPIITATFSDGYQESYGADLTAASPNATVLSIEHTLRDIAAGTYS